MRDMRLSQQFWFPGGVLLLCAASLHLWAVGLSAVEPFLTAFCLVALAIGAVLGWMYNRSRLVVSLAVFGTAAWLLPALYAANGATHWRLQTLALLLPLNVILFSLLPDQSLRARTSLLAAAILALQAVALAFLPRAAVPWIELQLKRTPLPPGWFRWSWAGQPALLAFGLAALLLAGHFLGRRRATDRGLFWSLVAVFVGMHAVHAPRLTVLYFGSGALILAVSLIEHAHAVAYADALTSLPNRRALDEFLPALHGHFSMAMVDIDHFKKFNDTYGHQAGDQVLRKVATHLATIYRTGRAFRYGGEEFCLVFAGHSCKEAGPHLEALRARIEEAAFSLRGPLRPKRKPRERRSSPRGGRKVHVTVSIGVAEPGDNSASPQAVIEAADRALYRAKQEGRNQVWMSRSN
jgi:diguanylate cyclase (GGDEF)-like protein